LRGRSSALQGGSASTTKGIRGGGDFLPKQRKWRDGGVWPGRALKEEEEVAWATRDVTGRQWGSGMGSGNAVEGAWPTARPGRGGEGSSGARVALG
jgi:hypothetical protein